MARRVTDSNFNPVEKVKYTISPARVGKRTDFEKLTLEGMSIVADNLSRFVEEELPDRCGGTPVDYQFTEEEDEEGITRLVLSVSPSIPMESDQIQDVLMELFYGLQSTTFAAKYLAQADSITVRREHPALTRSGKILTLRSIKKGANT